MSNYILGFLSGFFFYLIVVSVRTLRSGNWDTSNWTNVLRAIAFLPVHPKVYPHLVDERVPPNTDGSLNKKRNVFWYLPHDEFKEVVETSDGER